MMITAIAGIAPLHTTCFQFLRSPFDRFNLPSSEPLKKNVMSSTEALMPPKAKILPPTIAAAIIPDSESIRSLYAAKEMPSATKNANMSELEFMEIYGINGIYIGSYKVILSRMIQWKTILPIKL